MNNNNNSRSNNNNNNRRRGRNNGNNRGSGGGGGGGNQGNRIDSRARGNAPQMLEKYRKLAHDASLNDDRVLTEYYLQFADHYFRVMADMKAQRDEQQVRQGGRRDFQPGFDEDGEEGREQDRDENRDDPRNFGKLDYSRDNQDRGDGREQPRQNRQRSQRGPSDTVSEGFEGEADDGGNPFAAEPRQEREPREPRAPRQPREQSEPRSRKPARPRAEPRDDTPPDGLSADMLPPAIARGDDAEMDEKPVRKPLRVRTKRPRADEGDEETLEAVG